MDVKDLNGRRLPDVRREVPREPLVWPVTAAGLDWLPLPTLVLTAEGSAITANGAWAALSEIRPEGWRGNGWWQAIDPLDRAAVVARLRSAAAAGEAGCADWRLASRQGQRWSRWWWRPGPARGLVVCVTEMCDPTGEQDDWRRAAQAGLTPLLSSGQFLTLAGRALRRSDRAGGVVTVVVIELKGLLDGTSPPCVADRLLGAVIGRLAGAVRRADVVARLETGKFAVLYEDLRDQAEAELVAGRLRHSIQQPIDVDGRSYSMVAATGTAVASGPDEAAKALLARADAMLPGSPQTAGELVTAVTSAAAPAAHRRSRASSEIDLRIELTSTVIQRISWVGLLLASAVSLTEGQAADRVHRAVDELDTLIRDIRGSVFQLLIPLAAADQGRSS